MSHINVKKLGLAFGITGAILYIGCVLVMSTVNKQTAIFFFNSLLHGVDVTSILRVKMSWWEMILGIIEIFILSWLTGASIAAFYNLGGSSHTAS